MRSYHQIFFSPLWYLSFSFYFEGTKEADFPGVRNAARM